jgi:hypothetical protein
MEGSRVARFGAHAGLVLCFVVGSAAASPAKRQVEASASPTQTQRQLVEIEKLREEVAQLRATNLALGPKTRWLSVWVPVASAAIAAAIAWRLNGTINRVQQSKLQQEKELARERHLLDVAKELGNPAVGVRSAAVATLVQRLKRLSREIDQHDSAHEALALDGAKQQRLEAERARDRDEHASIVSVLIQASKHEASEEIHKYLADGLAEALGARPGAQLWDPERLESPLKAHDFQGAQLTNAWWKEIDARGVDFYRAKLTRAGLSNARFEGAMLRFADLRKAVLRNAHLAGANLSGADLRDAILDGADLTKANLEDADLTGARMQNVRLEGAKLSRAKGLPPAAS